MSLDRLIGTLFDPLVMQHNGPLSIRLQSNAFKKPSVYIVGLLTSVTGYRNHAVPC